METLIISAVNFYDCSNFNRKKGRTCPYNTPKVIHPSYNIHSQFLCRCTLFGNGVEFISIIYITNDGDSACYDGDNLSYRFPERIFATCNSFPS